MSRSCRREQLPELMSRSDFVVLALPLTSGTEDMFDAGLLAHAKPGAWLINVARGALIDERALLRALHEGRIGGAVLDTLPRRAPAEPDSPLYGVPNVIVTPHTSWSSGRVLDRSIDLFCDNLRALPAGPAAAQPRRPARRILTGPLPQRCRSRSWALPAPARRLSSTRLPGATAETGGFGG